MSDTRRRCTRCTLPLARRDANGVLVNGMAPHCASRTCPWCQKCRDKKGYPVPQEKRR